MIDYSDITSALCTQLLNNRLVSELLREKYIERAGPINEDPGRCGWIGVYRGKVDYKPRTLGSVNNWEAYPSIRVICQMASMDSGKDCEDRLEGFVKLVINAILADVTINNTVDMVNNFSVDYRYLEPERKKLYFQSAIITFNFEVKTQ